MHYPSIQNFRYLQPNSLEEIRAERPEGPRQLGSLDDSVLLDRLHGAWTGRAAGCALGKPVEAMGIRGQAGKSGRDAIRDYLKNRDDWPLDDYFSGALPAMTTLCIVHNRNGKTLPSWRPTTISITPHWFECLKPMGQILSGAM